MGKSEKKGKEGGEEPTPELSVKISGEPLRQVMAIRGDREKKTGKITAATEIVREAIERWYKGSYEKE